MAEVSTCVFCKQHDEHLILFTNETLKKCKLILKQRKLHNLKHKDVVLPRESYEDGYHRNCYKSFTGLMKKYYSKKLEATEKSRQQKNSLNIKEVTSTASTPNQATVCIVGNPSSASTSSLPTSILPESIVIPTPAATSELPESGSCNPEGHDVQPVSVVDSPSESNVLLESNVCIDENLQICIFCNKKSKKHRLKILPLHACDKNTFLTKLDGEDEALSELRNKIENSSSSTIYYHNKCQLHFFYEISSKTKIKTNWHDVRQLHQATFDEISVFIQENVINKKRCFFLHYLHRYYMELLKEMEEYEEVIIGSFTPQTLETKIEKAFNKEVKFLTFQNKKLIVPKDVMSIDEQLFEDLRNADVLNEAALLLRKSILQAKKNKLSNEILVSDLEEGEVSVTPQLLEFYNTMINGGRSKRKKSLQCIRQVRSLCEDVVYSVYDEKYKTSRDINSE
ncbi:hypothetical protein PV327_008130 [Microctonus hyperodae]|uniref:Uncharacterized protein n=1 Tax=Microctonus hyperodae TaxID=165561 RepID=A0AA39KGS9_MICHY|nr:hypothetical protein PV327_008130 [Microctonus hyperodae]